MACRALRLKINSLECSSNEASTCGSHLPYSNTLKTTLQENKYSIQRIQFILIYNYTKNQFDFQLFENYLSLLEKCSQIAMSLQLGEAPYIHMGWKEVSQPILDI